jgi:hypothetical protein
MPKTGTSTLLYNWQHFIMRKHPLLSVLFVFILLCIPGTMRNAFAQSAPVVVRITPATTQVGIGQTVDLAVEVVDVQAMYGFDVSVSFNPNAVELVDTDPNQVGVQVSLGTFMDAGFVIIDQVDNDAGSLRFAMTQLNPSVPKSGTGNLVVMSFKGKQVNLTSEINLTSVQIAQYDGTKISTFTKSGLVQVVQSVHGPTTTAIPYRPPGTALPAVDLVISPTPYLATSTPPVGAIVETQISPDHVAPGNVQVTPAIIGLAIGIGLGCILFGFVISMIVNKRRSSKRAE